MQQLVNALNYAIPVFLILILIEVIVAKFMSKEITHSMDMLSSLSSGMTNVVKQVFRLSIIIVAYETLVHYFAVTKIESTFLTYAIAFILLDFAGYWVHRLSHQVNFFWNRHIIHHSSEEFNLSCALRQTLSSFFAIGTLFLLPAAILGIETKVIAFLAPLHLFAQYWYHTRLIGKMGFLEKILVTPSHHRVHHAINEIYLDRNHSQIFIIWDKLFGTFQEELDNEVCVYGVKRPVRTWNPIRINFQHLWLMIKDAWRAKKWSDKFTIWFRPTGWRPKDVEEKFPVDAIDDVFTYEKYNPHVSNYVKIWSWIQLFVNFTLMMYLFNHIEAIAFENSLLFAFFIVYSVHCFTTLMDKSELAIIYEFARCIMALSLIFITGDFFQLGQIDAFLPSLLAIYFIFSLTVTIYFVRYEFRKETIRPEPIR